MNHNKKDRMARAFQFMEETGFIPQPADRDDERLWWTVDWRFSNGIICEKLDQYEDWSKAYFNTALDAVEKAIEITEWESKIGTD